MAAGYKEFYDEQKSEEEVESGAEDMEASDDDFDYPGKKKKGTLADKREMYVTQVRRELSSNLPTAASV